MRSLILSTICCFLCAFAFTQNALVKYNKHLANSLGADEYGMKMYVMVILKSGSYDIKDAKVRDSIFGGHMANIDRLAKAGKLVVAGPLEKNDKNYRGIFIFNVKTIDEAKLLLVTDPAVQSKALDAELYNWYGSAALTMYLPYHEQVQEKRF